MFVSSNTLLRTWAALFESLLKLYMATLEFLLSV
ncbi:hypothetical protein CBM2589_A70297 [Cupriavidus taiwanensis]|uniref:Uncharacterized protein n=1 Tax=Cupriavidus taiwanensis TaxID=164546 RepID=A0A975XAT1_9BURK|nr:hypothetical protein CBM2589_A70297 [Cupriavidus taiwanensis]